MAFILTELPDGFNCEVITPFWVSKKVEVRLGQRGFIINEYEGVGFLNSHSYIKDIFTLLYNTYQPINYRKTLRKSHTFQLSKIREGIATRQAKMHSKKIATQFNRLRKFVDQNLLKIERNCISFIGPKTGFSAYLSLAGLIKYSENEDKEFLIKDLMNYKVLCGKLGLEHKVYGTDWINRYTNGANIFAKRSFLECKKYIPSLNVTNCNFPEVMNSTQLMIFQTLQYDKEYDDNSIVGKRGIFSLKDIKKASKVYAEHFNQKSNLRKHRYVSQFCQYVIDYIRANPNDTKSTLTTLVRRSILWHRTADFSRLIAGLSPHQKTKSVPEFLTKYLEKFPEIKFLDTVEAVANEGASMGHCVAGYAGCAVRGQCYLFHVDKYDERATVELRRMLSNGQEVLAVGQSRGPYNQTNKASKWAEKFFSKILANEQNKLDSLPRLLYNNNELPF